MALPLRYQPSKCQPRALGHAAAAVPCRRFSVVAYMKCFVGLARDRCQVRTRGPSSAPMSQAAPSRGPAYARLTDADGSVWLCSQGSENRIA